MLRQRVLTALVLAPLAVWTTLSLSTTLFGVVIAAVVALGAWEWSGLSQLPAGMRPLYVVILLALLGALYLPLQESPASVLLVTLSIALLWWIVALVEVLRFPRWHPLWQRGPYAKAFAGVAVLVPAWLALVALHKLSAPAFVLLVMVLVWGADIGAYFAGKRFGKHLLAPQVSPGKTWEGLAGALATTLIIALIAARFLPVGDYFWGFLGLCLFTVVASVLGDLAESMFKRAVGAKDSGGLLPGHGGVLDRIDSLTAAAPIFALGLLIMLQGGR